MMGSMRTFEDFSPHPPLDTVVLLSTHCYRDHSSLDYRPFAPVGTHTVRHTTLGRPPDLESPPHRVQ